MRTDDFEFVLDIFEHPVVVIVTTRVLLRLPLRGFATRDARHAFNLMLL
jgi:hypothetical protein